jgi:hypothetical protein
VGDQPDVGPVHAEPEGGGRDDQPGAAVTKAAVHLVAPPTRHRTVVGHGVQPSAAQSLGQLLDPSTGRRVDDRALVVGLGQELCQALGDGVHVTALTHAEPDLLPVGVAHDHRRVGHAERRDDLTPDGGWGGGGQREHARSVQRVDDRPERGVIGSEVLAPRADAVGLVHHEQAGARGAQPLDQVLAGELLGGNQQELQGAAGEGVQDPVASPAADRTVQLVGSRPGLSQCGHLVGLQRDRRGDHQGRTVQPAGRDLVDERLSRPGGQYRERVAFEDRLHRLPLARPQRRDVVVQSTGVPRDIGRRRHGGPGTRRAGPHTSG